MAKDVTRVFITNLIKFFVSLIAIFLIPAILSVDEFGYYKIYGLYATYLGLFHFGYCDGMFLEYGGKNLNSVDKKHLSDERVSLLISEITITIAFVCLGIIRNDIIIIMLGLSITPGIFITFYTYLYQATGDFKKYANVYNFNSGLTLLINGLLVFIVRPSSGIVFVIAVVCINYSVALFASITFRKKYVLPRGHFDFLIIKNNISAGILLTIGNLSYLLFESIDRWFVKGLLGLTFFAYYSFAGQLLSALNMFANPIGLTLYSHLSKKKNKDFEYIIKITIISLLLFMLNGVYIIRWIVYCFFVKYEAAKTIIIILFAAQVFLLINTIVYVNLYKTYKKQIKYFLSLLIVIGLSISLNALYYFVFSKSMIAFAVATLCSMIGWTIVNLCNFSYLRLKFRHLMSLLILISTYLLTSFLLHEIMGLSIYFITWALCFRFLNTETYFLAINKGKNIIETVKFKFLKM